MIGLCWEVSAERRNSEDVYLQLVRRSSSSNYSIQRGSRDCVETIVPSVTEISILKWAVIFS